jgi:hypothetical protein
MDPVMRALQTIAAIESETRHPPLIEAASTCPSGDQVKANAPEAALTWEEEIRITKCDRVIAPTRDVTRHSVKIIVGSIISVAVAICVVWFGASDPIFSIGPASLPVKTVDSSADRSERAKPAQPSVQSANTVAITPGSAHGSSLRDGQRTDPSLTKQAARPAQPPAVERAGFSKPAAVPDTKPTTLEGWIIREVNGGTAILEGPNGVWKATRGDTIPTIGKIDSIVRWGNRWIVATSKGLISTR